MHFFFCGLYTMYLGEILYWVIVYFGFYIDLKLELYMVLNAHI